MVVLKKRSASAALMGAESSDDEDAPSELQAAELSPFSSEIASRFQPRTPDTNDHLAQRANGFVRSGKTNKTIFPASNFSQAKDENDSKRRSSPDSWSKTDGDESQNDGNDGEILEGNDIDFVTGAKYEESSTNSNSEDGEIDEDPEELNRKVGDMDSVSIALAVSKGGKDVAQHNMRYFMMENVVCSHCGIKGHLSYDCPEEVEERRCFLCGKTGHDSKCCPDEACFYCGETGHKKRDCPKKVLDRIRSYSGARSRHLRFNGKRRKISPPRPVPLFCYVCGGDGHVDCSLVRPPRALLSCCNCGVVGHAYKGCPEPSAEKWVSYVSEQQREKRTFSGRKDSSGSGRKSRNGSSHTPEETFEHAVRYREELKAAVNAIREVGFGTGRDRGRRESRGFMRE